MTQPTYTPDQIDRLRRRLRLADDAAWQAALDAARDHAIATISHYLSGLLGADADPTITKIVAETYSNDRNGDGTIDCYLTATITADGTHTPLDAADFPDIAVGAYDTDTLDTLAPILTDDDPHTDRRAILSLDKIRAWLTDHITD